ncbi:MAG: hypothetical protein ACRCSF_00145, partial [Mycobacteriaceae bacterium]
KTSSPPSSASPSVSTSIVTIVVTTTSNPNQPNYKKDCGLVTCTIYFSKSMTEFLASGGTTAVSTAICGAVGAATVAIGGVICGLSVAPYIAMANWAKSHGTCLKIKYSRFGPMAAWPDSYSGGNCA